MCIRDVSITEYIRRRRLTLAAFDLQNIRESILDISLKYGFDYWIGSVSEEKCPEGMEEKKIPASTWAVFEVIGPLRPLPNVMQDIWGRIYSEWLPNSGYQHAEIPEIEYYSDGDYMSETYRSEIWIPVVKA